MRTQELLDSSRRWEIWAVMLGRLEAITGSVGSRLRTASISAVPVMALAQPRLAGASPTDLQKSIYGPAAATGSRTSKVLVHPADFAGSESPDHCVNG